jgi:hypothetical protein
MPCSSASLGAAHCRHTRRDLDKAEFTKVPLAEINTIFERMIRKDRRPDRAGFSAE